MKPLSKDAMKPGTKIEIAEKLLCLIENHVVFHNEVIRDRCIQTGLMLLEHGLDEIAEMYRVEK